ncbi:MAG: DoxX family protein [Candidatus Thioglobus sp.]|nr:DoxX family protein [Candidatus Thioglobus sp.]
MSPVLSIINEPPSNTNLRLYVAEVFFRSGWLKFNSWDSTLYLFESEYQVPIISWELAAYLATAAELILPILLALGLATRLSALGLFLLNIVAVVSYSAIWASGYYDHKLWGLMLLVVIIYGQGRFSIDNLICKIHNKIGEK